MTTILPISDLHTEFWNGRSLYSFPHDIDIVISAGDTGVGVNGLQWLREQFPHSRIVAIAGNHEFWGADHQEQLFFLHEEAARLGIDFLEDEVVVINDIKFIGATLWTDFAIMGNQPLAMLNARDMVKDFHMISHNGLPITPDYLLGIHEASRLFIETELGDILHPGKTYVVTHHAPSSQSINQAFKDSFTNACFASNMDNVLAYLGPDMWQHGHTHSSFDYMVNHTRVICNPLGYHGYMTNQDFQNNKVIIL